MTTQWKKLGDVADDVTVGHVGPTSEFYRDRGVPFLRTQNVGVGEVSLDDLRYISEDFHRRLKKSALCRGDIVLSRVITNEVRVAVVPDDLHGSNCANVILIKPGSTLHSRYLLHFLQSTPAQESLMARTVGSAQTVVNTKVISGLRVPHRPLSEQRRIADILDKADAIRRKRKEAIALTEELLRSAFLEMFGDPVTNPRGWPVAPLADFGQIITGNTPPRERLDYYGSDIEWIKSDNINTEGHILTRAAEGLSSVGKSLARVAPARATLVTCIAGSPACIGNVGLADREVAFNQQINAVLPQASVDHRFLYSMLLVGKKLVQGASTNSMKGMVSKGRLAAVVFPRPPAAEQRRFGRVFEGVLHLEGHHRLALTLADSLFTSLLHQAFRGELTGSGIANASDDSKTGVLGAV